MAIFKTQKVTHENEVYEIREFSVKKRNELLAEQEKGEIHVPILLTKLSCVQCFDMTYEEIEDLPASLVDIISRTSLELNGMVEKKSDP